MSMQMDITKEMIEAAAQELAYQEAYVWGSSGLDHDSLREKALAILLAAHGGELSEDRKTNGRGRTWPAPHITCIRMEHEQ